MAIWGGGGGGKNTHRGLRAYCTCALLAATLSAADRDGKANMNFCKLLQMAPNSAVGGFSILYN